MTISNALRFGGVLAGVVLMTFGVVAIAMGINGRDTVRSSLRAEKIVGTPDSTIAGKLVDNGDRARAFAKVMRKHALAASGGKTYAEMPRFLGTDGKPTADETKAAKDPKTGTPIDNPARQLWVTETALSTALNVSYMAEQLAVFGIVVGIALLLSGVGFALIGLGLISFTTPGRAVHHIVAEAAQAPPTRANGARTTSV